MSDDDLIEAMCKRWYAPFLESLWDAMRDVLAIVREHDSAALTTERERADREVKNKKQFERDWLEACDQIDAMKKERDTERERAARAALDSAAEYKLFRDDSYRLLSECRAERDALRERVARLVGALQDIARSEVWYASELREMARTALGDK